jgi:hypothetical protein
MYWDVSQSALNSAPYRSFELTWIKADDSVIFPSVLGGGSSMLVVTDLAGGKSYRKIAKPLFSIKNAGCNGTNLTNPTYKGLIALDASATDIGKPWRTRKHVWIPILTVV